MKVLFFEPYAIWSPHYETCLEIIQNHLDLGDQVTFIGCNASLSACDANISHKISMCLRCISKRGKGLKLLSKQILFKNFLKLSDDDKKKLSTVETNFISLDAVKQYYIDNFDIGWSVASSFTHVKEDPYPDMLANRHIISNLMKSAYSVYLSFSHHLETDAYDRVYILNGRFAPIRGVLRLCQSRKVDCFIHERGSSIHKYALFKNSLPHDINYIETCIRETWQNSKDIDKEQIASDFYHTRARGKDQAWFSFVKKQKPGLLPNQWDLNKKNIVIFNSSEFEFSAIGDQWRNPLYESQVEGIRKIVVSMFPYRDQYHIFLRMHPNLSRVQNRSVTDFYDIVADNFTIIPPNSEVSTYELVRSADKVVTFGSTVGIEATFWGKPSILAGTCYYRNLDSVYMPSSHADLINMLLSNLQPKNKTGALMYAYYMNTFGINFKYFMAEGIFEGKFKNVKIRPSLFVDIISMILNLLQYNVIVSILKKCIPANSKGALAKE